MSTSSIRVGFYGTGRFAARTHIPNLRKIEGVQIVALSDVDPAALAHAASQVPAARRYQDGQQMLAAERLDVLYSCVPAHARSDVEITAARGGIHLFSEKPQALTIALAREIDDAIRAGNVLSTVGFRERYRPLFGEARRLLADKAVVHVEFLQVRWLGPRRGEERSWYDILETSGGPPLDWGVHAVDCVRYMTGHNIVLAQAFYCHPQAYALPLSSSFHFVLDNGATMTMTFVAALEGDVQRGSRPDFTIWYEGGSLQVHMYDEIRQDGQVVFRASEYDPWLAQDRAFMEAVRTGDGSVLASDYHDGLNTLAPVLAGWRSASAGGEVIDVGKWMTR